MTAFCTKCGVRIDVEPGCSECPLCHFDTVVALPSQERDKRCPWCGESCPRWGRETCPFRPRQLPRPSEEPQQFWRSSEESRQRPSSEDKLHAAAKRYHQLREDCRRLEKTRDRWQRSMALDSLREDLERATDDLRLAADEYGRDAG